MRCSVRPVLMSQRVVMRLGFGPLKGGGGHTHRKRDAPHGPWHHRIPGSGSEECSTGTVVVHTPSVRGVQWRVFAAAHSVVVHVRQ
jgi:hypothetical protein